jgi:hypothetical protein
MQIGTVGTYPFTIGRLIALLILIVTIVFWAIGQLDPRQALLLGGLALAILL